MLGKKWIGEMKGWYRGDTLIPFQQETEEFIERRNQLSKLVDQQLKVGETGNVVDGKDKDGHPIIVAVAYRGF